MPHRSSKADPRETVRRTSGWADAAKALREALLPSATGNGQAASGKTDCFTLQPGIARLRAMRHTGVQFNGIYRNWPHLSLPCAIFASSSPIRF
jgi:hypothetical protein